MKNADMPAMPLTGGAYVDVNDERYQSGEITVDGLGLTKREMFAMNAPEVPREYYLDFFNKHNINMTAVLYPLPNLAYQQRACLL